MNKQEIFDIIESSLALAGYDVIDGDRDNVIIRHGESDTDYEIKIEELPG